MIPTLFSRRILLTALAAFITFAIYGFIVHAILLGDMYAALPAGTWRTEAESEALMYWIFIAYALMAWSMAVLCPPGVNKAGEGLVLGALLGVFLGAVNLINYAIQPFPLNVTLIVYLADIVMVALAGAVTGLVAGLLDKQSAVD